MKLFITIPSFNEAKTLTSVIKSIPRKIKGIKNVKVLVYDDGSTDKTALVAKLAGADYVFQHKRNLGLAKTFVDAVSESLKLGADILVNTDADNQYDQKQIVDLVSPIIKNQADMVIGNRQVSTLKHMPLSKKYGNQLGSFVIRLLTGTKVEDASSGFRAITRQVALQAHVFSNHTYTHEMLIAAYFRNFTILETPVTFKKRLTGGSRLISKGVFDHILKSGSTIFRAVLLYRALAVFSYVGGVLCLLGIAGLSRFFYFAIFNQDPSGHIQSLVISSILLGIGFNIIVLGFIADIISYNRRLIEKNAVEKS